MHHIFTGNILQVKSVQSYILYRIIMKVKKSGLNIYHNFMRLENGEKQMGEEEILFIMN